MEWHQLFLPFHRKSLLTQNQNIVLLGILHWKKQNLTEPPHCQISFETPAAMFLSAGGRSGKRQRGC